jgi:predicted MFS family arabinose efflux permease
MTETASSSIDRRDVKSDRLNVISRVTNDIGDEYVQRWRVFAILLVLFLVSTISQVDRILPFITTESIKADLSLTDTQIGLLTGIAFAVCYSLMSLPLARAADRGSPRLVLFWCILGWSAMTALGGLAASFLFLAFTRFGVAFSEAGATPAGHAIIARKIRPERRDLAIGLFAIAIPLGTLAGFAIGGAISDTLGWRVALIGAGSIGVLIALLALMVCGPTPPLKNAATSSEPSVRSRMQLLSSQAFRWLFIGAVAGSFAAAPFYAFAVTFLIRFHGYTASGAGLAFGLLQGRRALLKRFSAGACSTARCAPVLGWCLGLPVLLSYRQRNDNRGVVHASRMGIDIAAGTEHVRVHDAMGIRRRTSGGR